VKRYEITIEGLTPLLMHADNIAFAEKIAAWRRDPANKEHSVSGDDRSPAWSWIGYLYHDGRHLGLPSDNLMTMLREGGARVKTARAGGKETFKKHTQAGIMLDRQQFDLFVDGAQIPLGAVEPLIGESDFATHIEAAEALGFELLVKRARVGQSKHVRVRAMFRDWTARGTVTVLDESLSGLTSGVIETVLNQAGALVGIGDWRPASPRASGTFGKFAPTVKAL